MKPCKNWTVFPHTIDKREDGYYVYNTENYLITVIKPKNEEVEKDLVWLLETKKFDLKEYQEMGGYWV